MEIMYLQELMDQTDAPDLEAVKTQELNQINPESQRVQHQEGMQYPKQQVMNNQWKRSSRQRNPGRPSPTALQFPN